ncbi:RNA polymerase sigma factor [Microlunatus sp. Gsoil 973]|uniref:RNA polymerase sigma factor n=1 Tax=Microlunatus sp. Gsoil 973 TaxID=2672569 RepID=UPI0018A878BD|nr:RNA polymerase sigma factor [Microlunatus sp. Gsoil 973]
MSPTIASPPGPTAQHRPVESVNWDETTLVVRAQAGEVAAFEFLVDTYEAPLYRLAVRLLRNRTIAEDVLQEGFIAAWRKLPTLNAPETFRAWIYRIITRRCLDQLRASRDQLQLDETNGGNTTRAGDTDPAITVETEQLRHSLNRALTDLPPQLRVCWILTEVDQLSYADISQVLDLPVSTVRGRLARARHQLAEGMASWR